MYYVYLLYSQKDLGYYIGRSDDLKQRCGDHIEGRVKATKHRRPLELVYYESYSRKELAVERELKLKQFGSAYVGLLKRLHLK